MYQSRIYQGEDYTIHMSRMDKSSFVIVGVTGKTSTAVMTINWKQADEWVKETLGLDLSKSDYVDCVDGKPTLTGNAS